MYANVIQLIDTVNYNTVAIQCSDQMFLITATRNAYFWSGLGLPFFLMLFNVVSLEEMYYNNDMIILANDRETNLKCNLPIVLYTATSPSSSILRDDNETI